MKSKINFFKKLIFITITCLISTECFANQNKCPQKFLLAEEASWPPFTTENQGTATRGLSFDLMNLIFSKINCNMEIHLFPQSRMLYLVEQGERDGVTVISKNPEREAYLHFIKTPLVIRKAYIYSLKNRPSPITFTSWKSLRNLKIGIVRGYNYPNDFLEAIKKIPLNIIEVNTMSQLFELLYYSRIDAFPSMDLIAQDFLQLPRYKKAIQQSTKPYAEFYYYLAISKKSPLMKLENELNSAILSLIQTNDFQKIFKKYNF